MVPSCLKLGEVPAWCVTYSHSPFHTQYLGFWTGTPASCTVRFFGFYFGTYNCPRCSSPAGFFFAGNRTEASTKPYSLILAYWTLPSDCLFSCPATYSGICFSLNRLCWVAGHTLSQTPAANFSRKVWHPGSELRQSICCRNQSSNLSGTFGSIHSRTGWFAPWSIASTAQ